MVEGNKRIKERKTRLIEPKGKLLFVETREEEIIPDAWVRTPRRTRIVEHLENEKNQ
jgi:hypothetical protein